MPARKPLRPAPNKSKKNPAPKPEGDRRKANPDDFDPLRGRDYKDYDGDAADPQRIGPGT